MPTNHKQRPSSRSAPAARPAAKGKAAPKPKAPARKAAAKPAAKKPAAGRRPAAKPAAARAKAAGSASKTAPAKSPARSQPASAKGSASAAAGSAKSPSAKGAAAAPTASAPAAPAPAPAAITSTYLVVLSAHERRGRRFVQLKSPSVLAWFQRGCRLAREGKGWAGDLGGEVRGLDVLFDAVENRKLPVPGSEAELQALLGKYLRAERDLEVEPHFVHVETDDDETEIEYFFFDDAFLESGEALDRLPSPKRRARPVADEDEPAEEETFADEDDDDPYTQLIEKIADA